MARTISSVRSRRGLVGGDDLGAGPVGGHLHREADLRAVAEEHGLEPVDLPVGHVLDEAEQVRARRHAGGALLFVGESLRGLDERLAHAAQVVEEDVALGSDEVELGHRRERTQVDSE